MIEQPRTSSDEREGPVVLAIVSGKGGSGKTLIATAIAEGLAICENRVLLVDADLATGGLSYYLGFSSYSRAREGLSEFIMGRTKHSLPIASARPEVVFNHRSFGLVDLVPVGEHRLLQRDGNSLDEEVLSRLLSAASEYDFVIFDCRGGIDHESLSVCTAAQEILVVVETDAAAIQASQHLINVLSESGNGRKVAGFILNKVMDDPSSLAKAGISLFRSECLGAVPFDIEATRSFIKGEIPQDTSLFAKHVFRITAKLFPKRASELERYTILRNEEFGTVTLKGPDYRYGALLIGLYLALLGGSIVVLEVQSWSSYASLTFESKLEYFLFFTFGLMSFAALSDGFKQVIGGTYRQFNQLIFRGRR
jgi:flagellar biosynthesis protein FlhG